MASRSSPGATDQTDGSLLRLMTDQIDEPARPTPDRSRRTRLAARARRAGLFVAGVAAAFVAVALYGVLVPAPRALTQADIQQGVDQALA